MKHSSPAKNFCKTTRCPSSQALLRYRHYDLSISGRTEIEIHLRECDFCNAELQLLMRHHHRVEEYRLAEMPRQLRKLAEDLLARSTIQFAPAGANRHSH